MTIQVNESLTRTRNPIEHGHEVNKRHGKVIHRIDDGYWLIEFFRLMIKLKKNIVTPEGKKKTIWVDARLQWYIHKDDLTVVPRLEK